MSAKSDADLIRARTCEDMAVAKAAGRLHGGKPKGVGQSPGRAMPRALAPPATSSSCSPRPSEVSSRPASVATSYQLMRYGTPVSSSDTAHGRLAAFASCAFGDVTKLDRLARSLRDATDIADELAKKGVALNLGGSVYDPTDPVGRLLFNVLGMVAEFEADLIRARTREGMAIAKAAGKLRGGKPKLNKAQERLLVELHRAGNHTTSDLAELFDVARATVYRAVHRAEPK
jgi:DNA invertase Pin-like site-specific DNA recombinase